MNNTEIHDLQTEDAARRAYEQKNYDQACELWRTIVRNDPDRPRGYLGLAEIFRALEKFSEADSILLDYEAENFCDPEVAVSFALNAHEAKNWPEALRRWESVLVSFPNVPVAWAGQVAILQILGRLSDAEKIADEGVRRFPNSIDIYAQYCNIALAMQDWLKLHERWSIFEERFSETSHANDQRGRIKANINAGLISMRDEELLLYANNVNSYNRPISTRLVALRELFGRNKLNRQVCLKFIETLKEAKNYDEAECVLEASLKVLSRDLELNAHFAEIAAVKGEWQEAATRWQKILDDFPDRSEIWGMAATAFRESDRPRQAEVLFQRAIDLEPNRLDLHIGYALSAEREGHWQDAIIRWNRALNLKPGDLNIQNSRGNAVWQEMTARLEGGISDIKMPVNMEGRDESAEATALRTLALSFEGLGDNCEFGIVQRRLGADPIGLLRFSAIKISTLISLIRERFERLGDPKFTELFINSHNEYFVRDMRDLYLMHSFVHKDSVNADKFLKQQVMRLQFLKRKIIEDLENQEKTFVYNATVPISDDEVISLYNALSEFGQNFLLVVRQTDDTTLHGSCKVMKERLLVAFAGLVQDKVINPDLEIWTKILQSSARYRNNIRELENV